MNNAERKRRKMMYVKALSYYGIKSMNGYSLPTLSEDALRERLSRERMREKEKGL